MWPGALNLWGEVGVVVYLSALHRVVKCGVRLRPKRGVDKQDHFGVPFVADNGRGAEVFWSGQREPPCWIVALWCCRGGNLPACVRQSHVR
jgi:hypothetical protein